MISAPSSIRSAKPLPFSEVTGKQSGGKRRYPRLRFRLQVKGKYNGEPLSGSGKIGGMLSLQSADLPFPLQADVRSGSTGLRWRAPCPIR